MLSSLIVEALPDTPTSTVEVGARPMCTVEVERADTTVLVTPRGELDAVTAPGLLSSVEDQLDDSCRDLIISCEHLTFVDSSGLRGLLAIRAACAGTDTRMHLVRTSSLLDHLLDLTGLAPAFRGS